MRPRFGRVIGPLAIAVVVSGGAGPARAAAGHLVPDPSFGGGKGWVTTGKPGLSLIAYATVALPNGKTAVAGQASDGKGHSQILVARYRKNGRLDPSFGSGGMFQSSFPAAQGPYLATGIGVQPKNGKVVVGGGFGQGSMLVLRLTKAGELDRTFGSGNRGYETTNVAGVANSLAVTSSGKILLGGSDANSNGRPMVVARYRKNGRLDTAFGKGGIAKAMFWDPTAASSAGATGLAVSPGGTITAAGHLDYIGGDGHGSAGVFRLSVDGRPVRSFGDSGHREVAFRTRSGGFAQWFPCAISVDSRNRTIVTGDGTMAGGGAILTLRLGARGGLSRSFGTEGTGRVITTGVTSGEATTCGAAATPSGGVTIGVEKWLLGLTRSGAPDRRFSATGLIRIGEPRAVSVQAVTRGARRTITAAGSAGNDFYVARYRHRP